MLLFCKTCVICVHIGRHKAHSVAPKDIEYTSMYVELWENDNCKLINYIERIKQTFAIFMILG